MTRDEARQLLPIIQAYSEGKEIEVRNHLGEWKEAHGWFNLPPADYRIKPEPIECWAVEYPSGAKSNLLYFKECDARKHANGCGRVIHMREVHE